MSKKIFYRQTNSEESSLTVNDDGTLTHWRANDGWAMARNGSEERETVMTAEEAKQRWPQHAAKIDEVLRNLRA